MVANVNKNTLLAFILILATLAVFTNPGYQKFYYSKILKQSYPQGIENNKDTGSIEGSAGKEIAQGKNEVKKIEESKTSETISSQNDTNKAINSDTIWIETE